jgi:hypothetical protein
VPGTYLAPGPSLTAELPAERFGLEVVGEGELAVDLDRRDELAIARLELRIAGDVDLDELELELAP